jgi:DNA polymerase
VDEKLQRIESLWKDCEGCTLACQRTNVVFWKGNCHAKLALIGEAPGQTEDKEGKPFVGRSGILLDELCETAGVEPWDTFICNVVGCRPPDNRKPTDEEWIACRGRLVSLLGVVKPKALLILGGTALRFLTGLEKITQSRGKEIKVKLKWYQKEPMEFGAIPTFHPSYLLRTAGKEGRDASRLVVQDIRQAFGLSQTSYLE